MMKSLLVFWKFLNKKIYFTKKPSLQNKASASEAKRIFVKPSEEVLHIQVGLDFGTNCSKACYSIIGSAHKVFPIIFDHTLSLFPNYTMPSVALFNGNGKLTIGAEAAKILEGQRWGQGIRNFKTLLAATDDRSFEDAVSRNTFNEHIIENKIDSKIVDPYIITAVYISYLMRSIRMIINNKYKGSRTNIIFNICIPVDYIEKNHVRTRFESSFALAEAIEKAWQSSTGDYDPLEVALKLRNQISYDEKDSVTRLFAIPEAVAEVVAYLKSSRKKTGLHALIDFGSGTTDVSIFNFLRGTEERSFWYAAKAIPYGVFQIEKALIGCLGELQQDTSFKYIVEVINNMVSMQKEYDKFLCCTKDELSKFFSSKMYKRTWTEAYIHLKKESAWRDVKIFLCGGGSQLPFVRDFASTPWWSHIDRSYEVEPLSKPEDFALPGNIPFYRMAVAYGLTLPKPLLRGYILPKDVPDHTPPPLQQKVTPDREELYPK